MEIRKNKRAVAVERSGTISEQLAFDAIDEDLDAQGLFSVDGIVAVVTGGGTGIGLMIARALEANGAERVYIVGRRMDVLEKAAKQSKFGKIIACQADITSKSQLQTLAERVGRERDRVDVLVNNAGVMAVRHKSLPLSPEDSVEELQAALWAEDAEGWAAQFQINVTAAFFTTVAFLGLMKKSNEYWACASSSPEEPIPKRTSQVITVSGIAAHARAMSNCMGYSASKAASLHLMKTLSTVLAPLDIRSNMLAPGIFPTEMTAGKGHLDEHNRNHLGSISRDQVPQGRAGNERDIAGAVLFLCGRSGWYCNGIEVIVDGGRLSIAPSTY